jgi:hypothetical protein
LTQEDKFSEAMKVVTKSADFDRSVETFNLEFLQKYYGQISFPELMKKSNISIDFIETNKMLNHILFFSKDLNVKSNSRCDERFQKITRLIRIKRKIQGLNSHNHINVRLTFQAM